MYPWVRVYVVFLLAGRTRKESIIIIAGHKSIDALVDVEQSNRKTDQ